MGCASIRCPPLFKRCCPGHTRMKMKTLRSLTSQMRSSLPPPFSKGKTDGIQSAPFMVCTSSSTTPANHKTVGRQEEGQMEKIEKGERGEQAQGWLGCLREGRERDDRSSQERPALSCGCKEGVRENGACSSRTVANENKREGERSKMHRAAEWLRGSSGSADNGAREANRHNTNSGRVCLSNMHSPFCKARWGRVIQLSRSKRQKVLPARD